jgi:hypothetical protein
MGTLVQVAIKKIDGPCEGKHENKRSEHEDDE